MTRDKLKFIIRNSAKALLWLTVFITVYLLFKKYIKIDFFNWLEPVYNNVPLVILIFLASEIIIGIIPPEIFIIWALRNDSTDEYIILLSILSVLSYLAGITAYFIGYYLNTTLYFRYLKNRYLKKVDVWLQSFGVYLIIIAALTPLPYGGSSMIIGSSNYSFTKFAGISSIRFMRFIAYAYLFWQLDPNL